MLDFERSFFDHRNRQLSARSDHLSIECSLIANYCKILAKWINIGYCIGSNIFYHFNVKWIKGLTNKWRYIRLIQIERRTVPHIEPFAQKYITNTNKFCNKYHSHEDGDHRIHSRMTCSWSWMRKLVMHLICSIFCMLIVLNWNGDDTCAATNNWKIEIKKNCQQHDNIFSKPNKERTPTDRDQMTACCYFLFVLCCLVPSFKMIQHFIGDPIGLECILFWMALQL